MGECGQYEDYRIWMVKGFFEREQAEIWAKNCKVCAANYYEKFNQLDRFYGLRYVGYKWPTREKTEFDLINPYDSGSGGQDFYDYGVDVLEVE